MVNKEIDSLDHLLYEFPALVWNVKASCYWSVIVLETDLSYESGYVLGYVHNRTKH